MTDMTDNDVLEAIRAEADVAVNVAVVSLGDPPGFVSGDVRATQQVVVNVTELRSGSGLQAGDRAELNVAVPSMAPYATCTSGVPSLDPSWFGQGQPFAAWVKWDGARWSTVLIDIERASG